MPVVRVLEHVPFATLAEVTADLVSAGATVDVRRLHAGEAAGDRSFDALVVLGGPQSAYSPDGFPSREDELALVRYCLAAAIPFFGICLGAQLLAVAAGGTAYPMGASVVGWTPLRVLPAAAEDLLASSWPEEVVVMESHSDHLTLPSSAVRLASSDSCPNELFRVGPAAWGAQFHPEAGVDFASTRLALLASESLSLWEGLSDSDAVVADSPERVSAFAPHRREMFTRFVAFASRSVPAQRRPGVPAST